MSEWTIQRITGLDEHGDPIIVDITTAHDVEYHGEWMGECFVTASIKSPSPIDWHFDDFLTYRGERFSISYDPNVVKKAARNTYGEGFTYDNIKFYFLGYKTKNFGFKDVVLSDNEMPYTSLATFSFFCSSVEDLADRLQANFDREQQSTLLGGFKVLTPDKARTKQRFGGTIPEEWYDYFDDYDESGTERILGEKDVNVDVDKQSCWDVMKYVYEKFGLSYYLSGDDVVIGGNAMHLNTGATNIFRYGKGLGLYEIERTSDDGQEIVTKLFAYGSDKNLPLNYYANIGKSFFANVTGLLSTTVCLDLTTRNDAMFPNWQSGQPNVVTVRIGNDELSAYVSWSSESLCYTLGNIDTSGISEGTKIYFLTGIDRNQWPSDHTESSYEYPSMLSVNRLMLPGFPAMSLDDWVQAKIASFDPETQASEKAEWESFYDRYIFSTNAQDPWVKSKNITSAGLFEGTVVYDGSQQREIYPTIENMPGCYVDSATQIEDNGYVDSGDVTFSITVHASFDLQAAFGNRSSDDDVYINMTTGYCTGRSFKVYGITEDDGLYVLECDRQKDESLGRYFPYNQDNLGNLYQVKYGDKFNITGIDMPDEFIEAAAERLLIASCGYLDRRDHMRYTYLPKIDEIFMARDRDANGSASYYYRIHAGMMLEFEDTDLGIWHTPYIDVLTIREGGNNGIPTFDVVLRDEKEKGTLEKLTDSIKDLMANPPMQVVERQAAPMMNVDYDQWTAGTPYYYQTLNTNPNPELNHGQPYVETSYVWHRGKKWMCLRTLTQEEPQLGCSDWKVVEGDQTFQIKFYDAQANGYAYGESVLVRIGHVNVPLWPFVLWGTEDVTAKVSSWQWRRTVAGTTVDFGTSRNITVTDQSLPDTWSAANPATFTCTATLNGIETQITNIVTV